MRSRIACAIRAVVFAVLLSICAGGAAEADTRSDHRAARHNELGTIYALQGRDDLALPQYVSVLSIDPQFAAPFNNLGNLRLLDGDVDSAIALYEVAAGLDPTDGNVRLNLGIAWYIAGREEISELEMQHALRLIGSVEEAANALGLWDVGPETGRAGDKPIDRETVKRLLMRARANVPKDSLPAPALQQKPRPRKVSVRAGIKGDAIENLRKIIYWECGSTTQDHADDEPPPRD